MREVIKTPPAPEFIEYVLAPLMEKDAAKSFHYFNQINKAHLLMLCRCRIVAAEPARSIFRAIRELEAQGIACIDLDPKREDFSSCVEAYILQRCGADIGGQLHTGRSRNDLGGTVTRMAAREALLRSAGQMNQLRQTMLQLAGANVETVCTGYTCGQPAEPVTVAYYFSGYLHALQRDFARLSGAYERLNQCPLGSCSMAGTSFPIDRAMVAADLGFYQETDNALDGIAARDYLLELLAALAIFGNHLSRFCQDMYIWVTHEFSFAEIGGEVAMCSSIMPQKKNPVTFEHVKGKSAHLLAAFISAAGALKGIPYTQVRDSSIEAAHSLGDALREIEGAAQLLIATLRTMRFSETHLLQMAEENFCTVSELANVLVRDCGLSFRQAHTVVGEAVAAILARGQKPMDITAGLLRDIAEKSCGKAICPTKDMIAAALDAGKNARSRNSAGGPAPDQVRRQLAALSEQLEKDAFWCAARRQELISAEARVEAEIDAILA